MKDMAAVFRQQFKHEGHRAYFIDYGNVKIIDFKIPGRNAHRIRFLFEEEFYTLHISGDYGNLTAVNYYNMNFKDFRKHYCNSIDYFAEKVVCNSRQMYTFDYDAAYNELKEQDVIKAYAERNDLDLDRTLKTILWDYDEDGKGIGTEGKEKLKEIYEDEYEVYLMSERIGYISTGILDLYMTAYEMAMEQLEGEVEG